MCVRCHIIAARRAQRSLAILTLVRDCAIDEGIKPGPMLLSEIAMLHAQQIDLEQQMLPWHLTKTGEAVFVTSL